MTEPVETIKTKNYIADIYYDTHAESPREINDNLGTLIAFHSRFDLSDNDYWQKEELINHVEQNDVLALPVYFYEHGGISLSTSEFSCKWDSGQVGYIFVSYEDIIKEYGKLDIQTAIKVLKGEVEEYSQYVNGEVYGYLIYNKEEQYDCPDSIYSCWGFIGDKYIKEEVNQILKKLEENKNENDITCC